MDFHHKLSSISKAMLFICSSVIVSTTYAATPVDLSHQNVAILGSFASLKSVSNAVELSEISRNVDFNKTTHVRIQETVAGYPVFGGDAVVHLPKTVAINASLTKTLMGAKNSAATMDGVVYQNLQADLANTPNTVFTPEQLQKAFTQAVKIYEETLGRTFSPLEKQSKLMVYIDNNNKAHWSYLISFVAPDKVKNQPPVKPTYILDAVSFKTYEQWNDMKTIDSAEGGGFGGNIKMGKLTYDGAADHLSVLHVSRDGNANVCYMKNPEVVVQKCDFNPESGGCTSGEDIKYSCQTTDQTHNLTYWDGDQDAVNDGYSPSNDALYNGEITKKMYQDWLHLPVLMNADGSPMVLQMYVHIPKYDNAFWNGHSMNFGDGDTMFYPLTSLDVTAHEISHGFTEQHSKLVYFGQSGGMNEAYSDMAGKAAEFYAHGKNGWELGAEIFKKENQALRYMDQPSKDCVNKAPGDNCSIDDATQFKFGLNVHYSSGVYNRFFYTLSTTKNWDTKKAFMVMAHANAHYWTSMATFQSAACGVIRAAKDYGFDVKDVRAAFDVVKVNTMLCFVVNSPVV